MIAAFLAAFMSTLGTQLNWGVSYLVNDLYRRFFAKDKSERHYVAIGRFLTIVLVLISGYVAGQLTSIGQGWQIVLELGIGTGAVYILRWYWWRINAWSEIVAMSVAAAVTLFLGNATLRQFFGLSKHPFDGNDAVVFAKTALITAGCTTLAWVLATFLTPPEPEDKLLSFYRRVHPTIYGWRKVARIAPDMPEIRDVGSNAFNWAMGCIMVYGTLFGIGKIIFGGWISGLLLLGMALVSGYLIFWDLSRRGWQTLSGISTRMPLASRTTSKV
jgi:SSS family solute:Na+ symporter